MLFFQISMLNKFSEAIRGNLTKIQRLKIVALVTIEVHARDIIDKLIKTGCSDQYAFDWLSQLRFYWEKVRYFFHSALYIPLLLSRIPLKQYGNCRDVKLKEEMAKPVFPRSGKSQRKVVFIQGQGKVMEF